MQFYRTDNKMFIIVFKGWLISTNVIKALANAMGVNISVFANACHRVRRLCHPYVHNLKQSQNEPRIVPLGTAHELFISETSPLKGPAAWEREREKEIDTDRQTDRQRQRDRDRERLRERGGGSL